MRFTRFVTDASLSRGFSLIELMVTVAVLAITLAIAAPSFQNVIASNQVSAASNDFLAALNLARAEAIRRGVRVTVCKGGAAVTECDMDAGSDWRNGWIIFVDPVVQDPPQIENAAADIIARGGGSYAASLRMLGQAAVANPTGLYASFTPDGASRLMNRDFLAGEWRVCSTNHSVNAERARAIAIGASGRAAVSKTAVGVTNTCPAP